LSNEYTEVTKGSPVADSIYIYIYIMYDISLYKYIFYNFYILYIININKHCTCEISFLISEYCFVMPIIINGNNKNICMYKKIE
jgi:hypothetical protein